MTSTPTLPHRMIGCWTLEAVKHEAKCYQLRACRNGVEVPLWFGRGPRSLDQVCAIIEGKDLTESSLDTWFWMELDKAQQTLARLALGLCQEEHADSAHDRVMEAIERSGGGSARPLDDRIDIRAVERFRADGMPFRLRQGPPRMVQEEAG